MPRPLLASSRPSAAAAWRASSGLRMPRSCTRPRSALPTMAIVGCAAVTDAMPHAIRTVTWRPTQLEGDETTAPDETGKSVLRACRVDHVIDQPQAGALL